MNSNRWLGPISILLTGLAAYAGLLEGPLIDAVGTLPEGWDVAQVRTLNCAFHLVAAVVLSHMVRAGLRAPFVPQLMQVHARVLGWGTAIIWVAHPIATACLFDAGQQVQSPFALCAFVACYASLSTLAGDERWWLYVAIAASALGMVLSPAMLLVPVLLFLFARAFAEGSVRKTWNAAPLLWSGLGATMLIAAGLLVTGSPDWLEPSYLIAQGRIVPRYFGALFAPSLLRLDHGPLVANAEHPLVSAYALLAVLGLAVVGTRTHPRIVWPVTWFLLLLAPSSSFFADWDLVGDDRRAYLALIPLLVCALSVPFLFFSNRTSGARLAGARAWVLGIVIAAFFCVGATRKRFAVWETVPDFWTRATVETPENPRAWSQHAGYLERGGLGLRAVEAYQRALSIDDDYQPAHIALARLFKAQGRQTEAALHLERVTTEADV